MLLLLTAWRENINFGKYTNIGNGYAMLIVGLPLSTTEFQKACAEYPEHPMKIRFGLLTSFGVNSQVILRNARLRHFILLIPMIRNVAPAVQLGGYIKCPRRKPLPIYGRISKTFSKKLSIIIIIFFFFVVILILLIFYIMTVFGTHPFQPTRITHEKEEFAQLTWTLVG